MVFILTSAKEALAPRSIPSPGAVPAAGSPARIGRAHHAAAAAGFSDGGGLVFRIPNSIKLLCDFLAADDAFPSSESGGAAGSGEPGGCGVGEASAWPEKAAAGSVPECSLDFSSPAVAGGAAEREIGASRHSLNVNNCYQYLNLVFNDSRRNSERLFGARSEAFKASFGSRGEDFEPTFIFLSPGALPEPAPVAGSPVPVGRGPFFF